MKQCFAPLVDDHCKVLILGSLPGDASLAANQYYAHPRNCFWRMLCEILEEPDPICYDKRCALLLQHHIALWDVVQQAHRQGSLDSAIQQPKVQDFDTFLASYPAIETILLNGGTAARLFQKQYPHLTATTLPSTSPANARMTYDQKKVLWQSALKEILI